MDRNQDAELNLRLTAAGYPVWFEPALSVAYHPRTSVRALAAQYHQYGRWRRVTAALHPSSLRIRQLAPPVLVSALLLALLQAIFTGWWWVALTAAVGYGVLLLAAGLRAAPRLTAVVPTAVALATMHLAWGLGFLSGPPRDAPGPTRSSDDR